MEPGYVAAVADSLVFALGDAWGRLAAVDAAISRDRVKAELAGLGVEIGFGDGTVPTVPEAAVGGLRDQLRRIRDAAPRALAAGADTFARILCTDPWPRIYTTAVLDWPSTTPVHVVQASDLAYAREQWARVVELEKFKDVRMLVMFGSPLYMAWPWDLAVFPRLQALDFSSSRLRWLLPDLANAVALEALELADNPLEADSLELLAALPSLRYVGLRGTGLTAAATASLRARLPAGCELAL